MTPLTTPRLQVFRTRNDPHASLTGAPHVADGSHDERGCVHRVPPSPGFRSPSPQWSPEGKGAQADAGVNLTAHLPCGWEYEEDAYSPEPYSKTSPPGPTPTPPRYVPHGVRRSSCRSPGRCRSPHTRVACAGAERGRRSAPHTLGRCQCRCRAPKTPRRLEQLHERRFPAQRLLCLCIPRHGLTWYPVHAGRSPLLQTADG